MYRDSAAEDRSVLVTAFSGHVLGLNPSDGGILWQVEVGGSTEIELVAHDGRLFVATGTHLVGIAYPSGQKLFDVEVPGSYQNRPSLVIERSILFLASGGEITAFDLDGNVVWHNGMSGFGVGRVALGFPGNFRQADDPGTR